MSEHELGTMLHNITRDGTAIVMIQHLARPCVSTQPDHVGPCGVKALAML